MNNENVLAMFEAEKKPSNVEVSVESVDDGARVTLASGDALTIRVLTGADLDSPALASKVTHMCEAHHHLAANL